MFAGLNGCHLQTYASWQASPTVPMFPGSYLPQDRLWGEDNKCLKGVASNGETGLCIGILINIPVYPLPNGSGLLDKEQRLGVNW